ncbi:MAG TPA: DUF4157 domain-containing protein [Kofleriaceae bacterium]|nr:DUF4157 domain-containing protein [Kofleriaceae bacterium]
MELRHQHRNEQDVAGDERLHREPEAEPQVWPGKRTRTADTTPEHDTRTPDLRRIRNALGALRASGKPLPGAMASEYGKLLGLDLSDVRVHHGGSAGAAAKQLGATAFTHGTNIALADQLDLDTAFGRHVIAHELVHVAQNKRSGGGAMDLAARLEVGPSGSAIEAEAEAGAAALTRGQPFTVASHGRLPGISRFNEGEQPPNASTPTVPVPSPTPSPNASQTPAPNQSTQPTQTPAQPNMTPAQPTPNQSVQPTQTPAPNQSPAPTQTPQPNGAQQQPGTQPGTSGTATPRNPTTTGGNTPSATPQPRPIRAATPAAELDARVQEELEKRADPKLKADYSKAVGSVDSLRIQSLQFSFTPNGIWNTLVETFTSRNAFRDHWGQIYSANAYRGGRSWVDTMQAWIEGLRGVVHIIGDIASVVASWAGMAALVTGALALVLSETVIGGIALGAIAAIAAEVATVAGAIKLLTDIIDFICGIIQMIILVIRARNSKDPGERARFAQLLHKEANDFASNVTSIVVQVAVMAASAGIASGASKGATTFTQELGKMLKPVVAPRAAIANIARLSRAVAPGAGVAAATGRDIFGNNAARRVLTVEAENGLINISRLQRNALGRVTRTRELVPFTAANQMRGARLVTMRNAIKSSLAVNTTGFKIGLSGGQLQAEIKQPKNLDRGGTSSNAPSVNQPNIPGARAGSDLSVVQMWPSQIEMFQTARGPLPDAVSRMQRQYEMAETQAGPELAAQVRQAFQGANNNSGQMRFGAMTVQTDAQQGQANTQRGLQQTQQARDGQNQMTQQQNAAGQSVNRIQSEGGKLQSPPPKEGVLGWLYNQTIGRIGGWIASAQKWVMNLVGKWAMSLAGFSKEEMDIAGIENDMREDDKKDQSSTQDAQDAALKADQIQQKVFELQENKTRDEQYAIQGMADAQRFIAQLEDADRRLAEAVTSGQTYIQQVTPVIRHELETQQAGNAIDAAYVAPIAGYVTAFTGSIDSSNVANQARTDGNGQLAAMKAAYPDLDITQGQTAIGQAVARYETAFGQLASSARTQAQAVNTTIQAFIGTTDYDGVHDNARALDALAGDFDRQAQALADQLYAAINGVLTQYNQHIQAAINAAMQVPDDPDDDQESLPDAPDSSVTAPTVPQAQPTTPAVQRKADPEAKQPTPPQQQAAAEQDARLAEADKKPGIAPTTTAPTPSTPSPKQPDAAQKPQEPGTKPEHKADAKQPVKAAKPVEKPGKHDAHATDHEPAPDAGGGGGGGGASEPAAASSPTTSARPTQHAPETEVTTPTVAPTSTATPTTKAASPAKAKRTEAERESQKPAGAQDGITHSEHVGAPTPAGDETADAEHEAASTERRASTQPAQDTTPSEASSNSASNDYPESAADDEDGAVQRRASGDAIATASPVDVATRATEGSGSTLPYLAEIQQSFGHHDVSGIRYHAGSAAQEGATALGAKAFAVGDAVAFKSTPDLHTAAHEAAHVVQQRAGLRPSGGIDGGAGDSLERHADAVADAVVSGRSAAPILDSLVGGASAGLTVGVQRKGATPVVTSTTAWAAPQNADVHRTTVGIGEELTFTSTVAGKWTATGGKPSSGDSNDSFAWTAPGSPGQFRITVDADGKKASKDIAVIAPSKMEFKVEERSADVQSGVGFSMGVRMTVHPLNVSFEGIKIREKEGPPSIATGYFKEAAKKGLDLTHHPKPKPTTIDPGNDAGIDYATLQDAQGDALPRPIKVGTLQWQIPYLYSCGDVTDKPFTIVTQTMTIVDSKGTVTITKGTAGDTRAPGAAQTVGEQREEKARKAKEAAEAKKSASKGHGEPGDSQGYGIGHGEDGGEGYAAEARGEGGGERAPRPQQAGGTTAQGAQLTHTAAARAEGGTPERTTVGVGEIINFASDRAGDWSASRVGPQGDQTWSDDTRYRWIAPVTEGSVTITFRPSGEHAGGSQRVTMNVIKPSGVDFVNKRDHALGGRAVGAGMTTHVKFQPNTVSWSRTSWKEIPGPASNVQGYFQGHTPPNHEANAAGRGGPNPNFLTMSGRGPTDVAAFSFTNSDPSQWADGSFDWVIPNRYQVDGESAEHEIGNVTQHCEMTAANGNVTVTVSKGSSSAQHTARLGRGGGGGGGRRGRRGRGSGQSATDSEGD